MKSLEDAIVFGLANGLIKLPKRKQLSVHRFKEINKERDKRVGKRDQPSKAGQPQRYVTHSL